MISTARRQIQHLQRETFTLHIDNRLRITDNQPFSHDKTMWSQASYKPKISVPKDLKNAELQPEILLINPDPRIEQLESSGSKPESNCPPNTPAVDEINAQHLNRQSVSQQEAVSYFKVNRRSRNENEGFKNEQSQTRGLAGGKHDKLTMKDIVSPKTITQNTCSCNKSKGQIVQDWTKTVKEKIGTAREVDHMENSKSQFITVSKTRSDAETNTEVGIPFRNTPNTSIINVKTQETSTRLDDTESRKCGLRKFLQIQTMPSVKIQPKFTIQKGPKVHIPSSSEGADTHMKRKNVELKEFFHSSMNIIYKERDNLQSDGKNVCEEITRDIDHANVDNRNMPNLSKETNFVNTREEISVHDKLNNLAKTLSLELDMDVKKKSKNYKKLNHTLKTLSDNITKLFDNYLETVPESLKRLSPRMNVIASLLLEELHSPHSLTDEYCCKLIDSMHYLIQDLEKEYEARVYQKNVQQPPQQNVIVSSSRGDKSELRRPDQKPIVHLENSHFQSSVKQYSRNSNLSNAVEKNHSQNLSVRLDSPEISEKIVKQIEKKKPIGSVGRQNTTSNVRNILQKSTNTERIPTTRFNNRKPLLESNYLKSKLMKNPTTVHSESIESGINLVNTGAIPKTNRQMIRTENEQERNYDLKQWQNERMKNIQEIHKKLLLTELKLTRPEKSYLEQNKAREIELDVSSDSSSDVEFIKKYIQTNNPVPEDSFVGKLTTPPLDSDNGNITEESSANVNKNNVETGSEKENENKSEEDETSVSEAVDADEVNKDVESDYAEDWEEDTASSDTTEEEQVKKSHLPTIEESEEISSLGDNKEKPANSGLKGIKLNEHDVLNTAEEQQRVQLTSENNIALSNTNEEEISTNKTLTSSLLRRSNVENVLTVKNVSKGCNTATKKNFSDGIDQIPLDLALFGFENNKSSPEVFSEKYKSEVKSAKLNTEQISDLSVPNINLDTSPIENLIQISVPKTKKQGNYVEVNTDKTSQSVNVVVHVVNDSDVNGYNVKSQSPALSNQESTSKPDKVIKNTITDNPSSSANLEDMKSFDGNINIDELISSNLKKYVIQPTVNEMFEKFKTETVLDTESVQNKTETKSKDHGTLSKGNETTLNLIKPNLILQSSSEFWQSLKEVPAPSQEKDTQSEKITQDFSVQTDCQKVTIQTQVTESLASESNQIKFYEDKSNRSNFNTNVTDVTNKYASSSQTKSTDCDTRVSDAIKSIVSSLQTKSSDSDTRPSSSTSSSSAVSYRLKSLKWSLSSLFNSDEPLSEGEVALSSSSSGAHSLGEIKSYSAVPSNHSMMSLGEIKTKPQRKTSKRGTDTSTPELTYSVSKEKSKSFSKYISPRPSEVNVKEKTVTGNYIDNKTENTSVKSTLVDNTCLIQPVNFTVPNPKRLHTNKIISKSFSELATDILQEIINENADDNESSRTIVTNVDYFGENSNTRNKADDIDLFYSENVKKNTDVESVHENVEGEIGRSNQIIDVTKKELNVQQISAKSQKTKRTLLKTSDKIKQTFEKPSITQLDRKNDRLVMKLEDHIPNLEVFIENTHSELSSVTLSGTSIESVSSDDLPGVCEFDLTLGSHSSGEVSGVNLYHCSTSSGS